jgi:WD40 repeat protein/uncharacterized caspase-like protein
MVKKYQRNLALLAPPLYERRKVMRKESPFSARQLGALAGLILLVGCVQAEVKPENAVHGLRSNQEHPTLQKQNRPELFIQLGHTDRVVDVAYSNDGKYILSGSYDKTLKLWNAITGREIRTFRGHSKWVRAVALSPDGNYALSGSTDETLKQWDLKTGKVLRTYSGHLGSVDSVAFSPDGRQLLSASIAGTVKLWDINADKPIWSSRGHSYAMEEAVFSKDGRYALAASDKELILYDLRAGRELKVLKGHSSDLLCAAISPDGKKALSGSEDNTAILWDLTNGRKLQTLKGHSHYVKAVAFSPDGKYALTGSWDKTIKLWDVATGEEIKCFKGHNRGIYALAFNPDGKSFISSGWDKDIKQWDLETGKEIKSFQGLSSYAHCMVVSPDGEYILAGYQDNTLKLWNAQTGELVKDLKGHDKWLKTVAYLPDGKRALSGSGDYTLKLWDLASGQVLKTFTGHKSTVREVRILKGGKLAVSGSADQTLKLWNLETGQEIRSFKGHEGSFATVEGVAVTSDGALAISASRDDTMKLWDTATGDELRVYRGHTDDVLCVDISPDDNFILSGSWDKTMKLWNIRSGEALRTFKGHTHSVETVAFSPDGKYALSGSLDNTIKLWEITTGKALLTLEGHGNAVQSVEFSSDGKRAFSSSYDGTVRIWDLKTGENTAIFACFTDGEWIVMTSEGYFNASEKGARNLNVRINNEVFSIDQFYRKFYRPEMVALALAGKPLPRTETIQGLVASKPAPKIQIISPSDGLTTQKESIDVQLAIEGEPSDTGDIYVYLNDSLVATDTRAIAVKQKGKRRIMSLRLALFPGENKIRAVAFNKDNSMASKPHEIRIQADFTFDSPTLYVFAVGIDRYENEGLNLNYAVADATLFVNSIEKTSAPLFKEIKTLVFTKPEETTKASIVKAFENLASEIRAGDFFLFYNSSHGYIATFNNGDSKYFLIPSNVVFVDPVNLTQTAISQDELVKLIGGVPAQNKIIVLDTCQAGEAGRVIQLSMNGVQKAYTRALSEGTAMQLLKMASGSSVLTAAQSMEDAIEGYKGHGLFTYTIVEGLHGKADGDHDRFITLNELKSYTEKNVYLRSKIHFNRKQIPYINIGTLDISLAKVLE